jgi:hypothetical protein
MLTLSLYDVAVTPYLQTLDAFSGVLAKGLAYFQDSGLDPDSFVDARFAPDMRPFGFQVHNVAFHSKGSVEAVLAGTLTFSRGDPNTTYAELQAQISEARSALRQVDADVLNACAGHKRWCSPCPTSRPGCSPPRASSCPSPCPICISTPPPPTTCCAKPARPWASGTIWASCG